MKYMHKVTGALLFSLLLASCGYDNYDEPKSQLNGELVYNNQAINVRGSGSTIQIQLYQDGYAYKTPITVYANQEGKFNTQLFDGEYKMVTRDGQGPWVNSRDTTIIQVKGNTTCKLEVIPFFLVSNESITLTGDKAVFSFTLDQIVSEASVSDAILILSNTQFVDNAVNIARKSVVPVVGSNTYEFDLSDNDKVKSATALYARIGVLTQGNGERIYSNVVKIK